MNFNFEEPNKAFVYCDGAIKGIRYEEGKERFGGIAIAPKNNYPFEKMGISLADSKLTNNAIELLAGLLSILFTVDKYTDERNLNIIVKSDSEYVVKGFNERMEKWNVNNWKTSDNNDVKNRELWELMLCTKSILQRKNFYIKFVWVKGHTENLNTDDEIYNDKVDKLAVKYKEEQINPFSLDESINFIKDFLKILESRFK